MNPLKSNRLAWSVAVAALALWATSAPLSWGQVAAGSSRLFDQTTTTTTTDDIAIDDQTGSTITTTSANDPSAQIPPCPTVPPAIAQLLLPTPVPAVTPGQDGTFHICGADPDAERAIAALVAGRGFSATLSAHGDGCADLTVRPSGQVSSGTNSSNLSVSLGAGKTLSIQIVSEQGATRASITTR